MRIAIDVRVADPEPSGQQRYLWRLGAWLAGEGHEVHYLTVRAQPDHVTVPAGCTLHRLDRESATGVHRFTERLDADVLLLNPERSRMYEHVRPNVLRAAYGTDQYRQKMRSFRNPGARLLRSALRTTPWTLRDRARERRFYEGAATPPWVIVQSAYMRDEVLRSYRIPEDHVRVVYNGVDTSEFSAARRLVARDEMRARWSIPPDALCCLLLGHNFRLKGLDTLLHATAALRIRGAAIHVLVAGRGTGAAQRRAAGRRVRTLGLEDHVTFAGDVTPSMRVLAAADVLAHLSWHDSFGFAVLEAMATGLPVVTTSWVGASEIVRDGDSGLVVDPAKAAEVEGALARLHDDPAHRALMGRNAEGAARQYDEVTSFRGVLGVLESVSGER